MLECHRILLVSVDGLNIVAEFLQSDLEEFLEMPVAVATTAEEARKLIPGADLVLFYYHGTWVELPDKQESRIGRAFADEMEVFGVRWILLESPTSASPDNAIGASAWCRIRFEAGAEQKLATKVRTALTP